MLASLKKPIFVYLRGLETCSKNRRLLGFVGRHFPPGYLLDFSANQEAFLTALRRQIRSTGGTAVLCGGDGMAHHAIQLLAGSSTALLPLPGGTANDLSRELGWCPPSGGIVAIEHRWIDCLCVNKRLVATVGGYGLGSEVIRRIQRSNSDGRSVGLTSKKIGKWVYVIVSAEEVLRRTHPQTRFTIEHSHGCWKGMSSSILLCNQGTLAGTFTVCGSSKNNDGLFEIIVSKPESAAVSIVGGLASILFHNPLKNSAATTVSTDRARIKILSQATGQLFADGELLPRPADNEYTVTLEPKILKVVRRI
jgi:diacylglycerol kinase family enzyme